MFCTTLSFSRVNEWFQAQNYYKYLCLFVSSYNDEDRMITEMVYKKKLMIDRMTGHDICLFYFTPGDKTIVSANSSHDFISYQIDQLKHDKYLDCLIASNSHENIAFETNIDIAEDVCSTYHIYQSSLPAFIFIGKDKINQPLVYTIKNFEDFNALLKPINAINTFVNDKNQVDSMIHLYTKNLESRIELDNLLTAKPEYSLDLVISNMAKILSDRANDYNISIQNITEQVKHKPYNCKKIIYSAFPWLTKDRDLSKAVKHIHKAFKYSLGNQNQRIKILESELNKYGDILTVSDYKDLINKHIAEIENINKIFIENMLNYLNLDTSSINNIMNDLDNKRSLTPYALKLILNHIKNDSTNDIATNNLCCNVFIAGSKALIQQRTQLRAALMEMQNLWGVMFMAKTFEDFSASLTHRAEGRQGDYNDFIRDKADVVVFVFDGAIGDITLQEFDLAFETMKQRNGVKPQIYVFFNRTSELSNNSHKMDNIVFKLNSIHQYYIDYTSNEELNRKFKDSINRYLVGRYISK